MAEAVQKTMFQVLVGVGVSLFMKRLVWVGLLSLPLYGRSWRPESFIADGIWAGVPFMAHALFAAVSLIAIFTGSYARAEDQKKGQ